MHPSRARSSLAWALSLGTVAYALGKFAAGSMTDLLGGRRNYLLGMAGAVVCTAALALGAVVALALTLVASVRRRRRDLALLKALGFTPRQLARVVSWQASVTALTGVFVGVPLGILVGRQLWTLFARTISAVPDPTVPIVSVILVVLGSLIFANLVATIPGRFAARTSTALALRSE